MIMDISKKEQTQTAGDNSVQNQVENQYNYSSTQINQYYGVTPTEVVSMATTVYNQMYALSVKNYAKIASTTVEEKVHALRCELFPRLERIEGALEKFKDPRFEFLLLDAQIAAAKTDRPEDLGLLSELLCCHVQKGTDKKIDAGISHAIRIVDEIDNDALCALTIVCAVMFYSLASNNLKEGLSFLNNLYDKLIYTRLPIGVDWLDHLDMLGALRMTPFAFGKSKEYFCSKYSKYACTGVKKGTNDFDKVIDVLKTNNFPCSVLVDNECLDGYMRLDIADDFELKQEEKEALLQVKNYYTKDNVAMRLACDNFIKMWDSYENLKKVRTWWDTIPQDFNISHLGRVLAQTNLKRIDPSLPDLI